MSAERRYRPARPIAWFRWIVTFAVVVPLVLSAITVDADWSRLFTRAPERSLTFVSNLVGNFSLEYLGRALGEMWVSVAIAWIAALLGAAMSFPLVFLASSNLAPRPVVFVTRQVLNVFRAIPEIVLAIALLPFFGLSPVTAAVAMGVSSIGTLGKLSAEIVEGIDKGPLEAVDASGGGWLHKLRWAVLPQAMPEIAAFWLYRFEINIRISAVLGVIGIGGIGGFIAEATRFGAFDRVGIGLLVVVMVTMTIDQLSAMVRRRLISGPPMRGAEGGEAELA